MVIHRPQQLGFTLIELMLIVAIIGLLTSIAIPTYKGYITEAQLGVARANVGSLRLFMEDYQLSEGTYIADSTITTYTQSSSATDIATHYGWRPDGDEGLYTYVVTAAATTWDVLATHNSGNWLRCENRMSKCCAKGDSGALSTACP